MYYIHTNVCIVYLDEKAAIWPVLTCGLACGVCSEAESLCAVFLDVVFVVVREWREANCQKGAMGRPLCADGHFLCVTTTILSGDIHWVVYVFLV